MTQTDDLVAPPFTRNLKPGTKEYAAAVAAEVAYWSPFFRACWEKKKREEEEERLAKANAVRLASRRELSIEGECQHIEQRTAALIERERGLGDRSMLVEVRVLGEWHTRQAQVHTQAAKLAQRWGRR